MKKLFKTGSKLLIVLLIAQQGVAQNNSAPVANPEIKNSNAEQLLRPTADKPVLPEVKEPLKPLGQPVFWMETSKPELPPSIIKPLVEEPKPVTPGSQPYQPLQLKNVERPKPETIGDLSNRIIQIPIKRL